MANKDIHGKPIKLGQTVRHFFNGEWRTEKVGWRYDSILERRRWVYKPSCLSIKYSTMTHDGSMAAGYELTDKFDKKGHRLWERKSPEIL